MENQIWRNGGFEEIRGHNTDMDAELTAEAMKQFEEHIKINHKYNGGKTL